MIIKISDDSSIVEWKKNDKEDWKSAEISDLIKAYEERSQGDIFPMKIVAGDCPIEADGNCPLKPQGDWINHRNDYGHNIADCSECGKTMQWHDEDEDGISRYCWNCGARMKGGKEE